MIDSNVLRVYFIADPALCAGRALEDVVLAAARGGVTMVQLRNKHDPQNVVTAQAAVLVEMLRVFSIPLVVNDNPHIAFAAGAAGVHLGQGDMDPASARKILGQDAIIGRTAFTLEQMRAIDLAMVDYAGIGPVYPTQTDKGKPVLGPEGFSKLRTLCPVPAVGIGGITPNNASAVLSAGADGVAMMRSISEAPDPEQAARSFVQRQNA